MDPHGAYRTQHEAYRTQHGAYRTQHGAYRTGLSCHNILRTLHHWTADFSQLSVEPTITSQAANNLRECVTL